MAKRANHAQRNAIRARLRAIGAPCAICGRPIDYDLDWWTDPKDGKRKRHPMSFEYDHIDPLSVSEDNSFANAQAAHRICNQRKGNRMPVRGRETAREAVVRQLPTSRSW